MAESSAWWIYADEDGDELKGGIYDSEDTNDSGGIYSSKRICGNGCGSWRIIRED